MNNLSINFFGEIAEIPIPYDLSSLREKISEKFLFSKEDAEELIIKYNKNLKTKQIKTEKDFQKFIKDKIFQIELDIDQKSQIFQQNLIQIQKEIDDKKELVMLINRNEELKNKLIEVKNKSKGQIEKLNLKWKDLEIKKEKYLSVINSYKKIYEELIEAIKNNAEHDEKSINKEMKTINEKINNLQNGIQFPKDKKMINDKDNNIFLSKTNFNEVDDDNFFLENVSYDEDE